MQLPLTHTRTPSFARPTSSYRGKASDTSATESRLDYPKGATPKTNKETMPNALRTLSSDRIVTPTSSHSMQTAHCSSRKARAKQAGDGFHTHGVRNCHEAVVHSVPALPSMMWRPGLYCSGSDMHCHSLPERVIRSSMC
jgi:hypothetical protein